MKRSTSHNRTARRIYQIGIQLAGLLGLICQLAKHLMRDRQAVCLSGRGTVCKKLFVRFQNLQYPYGMEDDTGTGY